MFFPALVLPCSAEAVALCVDFHIVRRIANTTQGDVYFGLNTHVLLGSTL